MCDKQTIQRFFSGFLSIFRLGVVDIKQPKTEEISHYIFCVEDDINTAYRNLKNEHERN